MNYQNRLADNDMLQEKIWAHRPLDTYEVKQLKEYYRIGLALKVFTPRFQKRS